MNNYHGQKFHKQNKEWVSTHIKFVGALFYHEPGCEHNQEK